MSLKKEVKRSQAPPAIKIKLQSLIALHLKQLKNYMLF
jgi:hypothetical protein